jgi:AmmeMemoRadiSam system protein B
MIRRDEIRPPGVAGFFYPADKKLLGRDISLFLENSPRLNLTEPIRAMIVPHAGYMYSGGVAARAYRQIMGKKYDVVVIIAPSHHEYFEFIAVYPGKAFRTPLGDLPVDEGLVNQLTAQHPDIRLSHKGFSSSEHSLEVQLPFLKWVGDNYIVPVMMGHQTREIIEVVRSALVTVLKGREFLVIASSDLSHFYSDSRARELDRVVMDDVSEFSPEQLFEDIAHDRCEMCGYGPAISAMKVARDCGAKEGRVLLYRTSGDITGDKRKVVGYLSGIFY